MLDTFTVLSWFIIVLAIYIASYYILLYFDAYSEPKKKRTRPEITIAVPAYNEEKNIYATLLSLKNSKYPSKKLHVVVVDDGSVDGTAKEARRFMRENPEFDVKLIVNRKNKGKAAAMNKVIRRTKSEYIITMDADSEADPLAIRA
ncbi:MAG: glycosyltransferase, partial [Candidatus Altiarchaeota archaeon]|nr:glycosyltransferase [Candidatus Altiarchaeota archaeon]